MKLNGRAGWFVPPWAEDELIFAFVQIEAQPGDTRQMQLRPKQVDERLHLLRAVGSDCDFFA